MALGEIPGLFCTVDGGPQTADGRLSSPWGADRPRTAGGMMVTVDGRPQTTVGQTFEPVGEADRQRISNE